MRRQSNAKGSCCCPGDIRFFLLLLLLLLSTNRFSILEPQWHLDAPFAFHQPATNQVGGDQLSGAAEEALGEGWEVLGDGLGGYRSGSYDKEIAEFCNIKNIT